MTVADPADGRPTVLPLVAARGLSKRYQIGGVPIDALAGVDLDLARREWLAVTGPSGSGKSTLLSLIGGLDRATAGSITVAGRDLGALDGGGLARHRRETVGFVFQAFRLLTHLTARENVAVPLLLAGRSRDEAEGRAAALLGHVGLARREAHRPPQLSAGEQQRVAIARALANGPRLILADEPTGNLDAAAASEVLDLLAELRRSDGLALVVATHSPDVAARADHAILLEAGRIAIPAGRRWP